MASVPSCKEVLPCTGCTNHLVPCCRHYMLHANDSVQVLTLLPAGGLLNVTFGNAVELILSIVALLKGLYIVVEYSLIGSILSNCLLVLGESLASCLALQVHRLV